LGVLKSVFVPSTFLPSSMKTLLYTKESSRRVVVRNSSLIPLAAPCIFLGSVFRASRIVDEMDPGPVNARGGELRIVRILSHCSVSMSLSILSSSLRAACVRTDLPSEAAA